MNDHEFVPCDDCNAKGEGNPNCAVCHDNKASIDYWRENCKVANARRRRAEKVITACVAGVLDALERFLHTDDKGGDDGCP